MITPRPDSDQRMYKELLEAFSSDRIITRASNARNHPLMVHTLSSCSHKRRLDRNRYLFAILHVHAHRDMNTCIHVAVHFTIKGRALGLVYVNHRTTQHGTQTDCKRQCKCKHFASRMRIGLWQLRRTPENRDCKPRGQTTWKPPSHNCTNLTASGCPPVQPRGPHGFKPVTLSRRGFFHLDHWTNL